MLLLKTAALLALVPFIALALVLASAGREQRNPLQVSPTYQWNDLSSLSVEDINRKTLEAADAVRVKQAERFLQRQH
jgi:hypothetical protein